MIEAVRDADPIGQRLGADRFDHWVRAFGFGKPTGVDLPGEQAGIVLAREKYSGSSMGNLPIGQGEAVTPMQMATAYAALANGGILRPPHLVEAAWPIRQARVVAQVDEVLVRHRDEAFVQDGEAPDARVEDADRAKIHEGDCRERLPCAP